MLFIDHLQGRLSDEAQELLELLLRERLVEPVVLVREQIRQFHTCDRCTKKKGVRGGSSARETQVTGEGLYLSWYCLFS